MLHSHHNGDPTLIKMMGRHDGRKAMVRLHAPEREHVDLIVASVAGGAGAASDQNTQPPDLIRRSWARCLNSHRLDPARPGRPPARPGRPVVLTQNELGGFREPMEE